MCSGLEKNLLQRIWAISPECVRCIEKGWSIEHTFCHCPVICPLCELIEGYMICLPRGQFFVLEAGSVWSNVSSLSDKKHCISVLASRDVYVGIDNDNE